MPVVKYVPLQSPNAPFKFMGDYYTRDELIRRGMDYVCHLAILEYTS